MQFLRQQDFLPFCFYSEIQPFQSRHTFANSGNEDKTSAVSVRLHLKTSPFLVSGESIVANINISSSFLSFSWNVSRLVHEARACILHRGNLWSTAAFFFFSIYFHFFSPLDHERKLGKEIAKRTKRTCRREGRHLVTVMLDSSSGSCGVNATFSC